MLRGVVLCSFDWRVRVVVLLIGSLRDKGNGCY